MQPRQYTILKWCVYGGATLALCLVQTCLLRFVRVWGVVPFLYPMLAAVVSTSADVPVCPPCSALRRPCA